MSPPSLIGTANCYARETREYSYVAVRNAQGKRSLSKSIASGKSSIRWKSRERIAISWHRTIQSGTGEISPQLYSKM